MKALRALGLFLVALSTWLHCIPAAAADKGTVHRCIMFHTLPGYPDPLERPRVWVRDQLVRVDNRCNEQPGLVIVWKPYENSSETFWTPAGAMVTHPTLHVGRVKVWVRFPDGTGYTYSKKG